METHRRLAVAPQVEEHAAGEWIGFRAFAPSCCTDSTGTTCAANP